MKRYSEEERRQIHRAFMLAEDAKEQDRLRDEWGSLFRLSDGTYIKLDELVEAVEKMEGVIIWGKTESK